MRLQYTYPEVALADRPDEIRKVKRLAARVGRTFDEAGKHAAATRQLRECLATLGTGSLRYWAQVVMIDHRWCGATGTGAFWAVASRVTNELARAILEERGRNQPPFQVVGPGPRGDQEAARSAEARARSASTRSRHPSTHAAAEEHES